MKILLTTPLLGDFPIRDPQFPLGITYIAGVIEQEGHLVRILDNYLEKNNESDFVKVIEDFKPAIIGITCNVDNRFEAFALSRTIKEFSKDIIVILGGPFPSVCHKEIIDDIKSVDIVVREEGEYTLLDIVGCLESRKTFDDIAGITYRIKDGVKINQPRPFIQNLDALPFPAFHLLKIKEYSNVMAEYKDSFLDKTNIDFAHVAGLIFGRGCPHNCLFCSSKELWRRTFRILSPENAVRQIEYFIEKKITAFAFFDDHFLLDKRWFNDFVQRIKEKKLQFIFKCLGRVDSIDEETARKLREIGCKMIYLGIENGSQDILNLMNKGVTVAQIENSVKILSENGILAIGGSLVNTPGETWENILENLKFFKKLEQTYSRHQGKPKGMIMYRPANIIIYPGTDLEKIAIKKGRLINFKWTKDYYEKRNLLMDRSPYTPLYENVAIEKLVEYLIIGALKIRYYTLLIDITWHQIVEGDICSKSVGKNYKRKFYFSKVFYFISRAPFRDKVGYIYTLLSYVIFFKVKNKVIRIITKGTRYALHKA